ncbi:MAG: DUF523 domain-containing protein [Sulfurovum sp.]|nr:DUF523 domain-containing protein [Sulfurovum sp.]
MKNIAISACLLGEKCRYDAGDNKNEALLAQLQGHTLIPFCPEDYAFGSPRPTMDLVRSKEVNKAISNKTGQDISLPVIGYANAFFDKHEKIDLYIGKERSPSCGVCSARVYDEKKNLLSENESGLMANEALKRDIPCIDAENFKGIE